MCAELEQPDIIGTETWIDNSVSNSEILPNGYTAVRKDHLVNGSPLAKMKKSIPDMSLP